MPIPSTSIPNLLEEISQSCPPLNNYGLIGTSIENPWHGSTTGQNFHIYSEDSAFCFRVGHHKSYNRFWAYAIDQHYANCEDIGEVKGNQFWIILKKVAKDINYQLADISERERESIELYLLEKENINRLFDESCSFFVSNLKSDHLKWIKEKYVYDDKIIHNQRLGFAPGFGLKKYLLEKGFTEELIHKSGLFIKIGENFKEFFDKRIIFPYLDGNQPKYFIGRLTPWTPNTKYEQAKYKKQIKRSEKHNYVSETINEIIFGIDSIKQPYKNGFSNKIIIVEGIADAITGIQYKIPVLSPVTIRFKKSHVETFEKLIGEKELYICMDNEESKAGNKATEDLVNSLREKHIPTKYITLPRPENCDKIDLNDYFKDHCITDFKKLISLADQEYDNYVEINNPLRILKNQLIDNDFGYWSEDSKGTPKFNFSPNLGAEALKRKYPGVTLLGTDEVRTYIDGYYKEFGEERLGKEMELSIPHLLQPESRVKDTISHYKRKTYANRLTGFEDTTNPWIINVKNGILNIRTLEFVEHTPKRKFLIQHPVIYDPEASFEPWETFINEVIAPGDIQVTQEFVGYLLLAQMKYKKMLTLVGPRDSGKTTFQNVLQRWLGDNLCSNVDLKAMALDNHATYDLYLKKANFIGDMAEEKIHEPSLFMKLVGNDKISMNPKNKRRFSYLNYAKLIMGVNNPPDINKMKRETLDAFIERILLIGFPYTIPNEKKDTDLLDKLTMPENLSGLLNWAIIGLQRLLKNNQFSVTNSNDEVLKLWNRRANPIDAFLYEECEFESDDTEDEEESKKMFVTTSDDLFTAYTYWCINKNNPQIKPVSQTMLGRFLKGYKDITKDKLTENKKKKVAYFGICLKNIDWKENDNSPEKQGGLDKFV